MIPLADASTHAAMLDLDKVIEFADIYSYKPFANPDDQDVVLKNPCPDCNSERYYLGFKRPDGQYRAFAVCKEADKAQEF